MKILVTGGAGFIGSALIRHVISETSHVVVNVDNLSYAGNLASLATVDASTRYEFFNADIRDSRAMEAVFESTAPDAVVHLAAESHVDRSIEGPDAFVTTNVVGTSTLLSVALRYFLALPSERRSRFRFHHVSTDEVFGSLPESGSFHPDTRYDPRSPYSASKAAADHFVSAWHHTYGLPTIISNCSNNYGPYQFPEKLIPLMTIRGLRELSLPVYGKGTNVRDWLFVEDHARALLAILEHGRIGATYLVGGGAERQNIEVVRAIAGLLDEMRPRSGGVSHADLIELVQDRPGHDHRYSIDYSQTESELGWRPLTDFGRGLRRTVQWYLEREDWWAPILEQRDHVERAGLRLDSTPGTSA